MRFSCQTDDWALAAERAREYEATSGHFERRPAARRASAPLLGEFAERCLEEDMAHLAATSAADRRTHLRPGGPLIEHFGAWPLGEITPAALREWWSIYVANSDERGPKTGREYVNALSAVFGYAIDLGLIERSPIPDFRAQLRRRSRTKQARAGRASKINPITDPTALGRLLEAARERSLRSYVAVLLMLDAGLRLGEATGLTWGQVVWGRDADDRSRALIIDRNCPRGGPEEATKSGRERRVPLSRRLRAALRELHLAMGRPGPEVRALGSLDHRNFRRREWDPICRDAGLVGHTPKDLRDTFASWLVSLGAPLPFVQKALGHANWAVTAEHYARWVPHAECIEPARLGKGDVWPDVLARLEGEAGGHASATGSEGA
jgi:integrase